MTSITSRYLEAAIIDQSAAGLFHDRPYAFVAVYGDNAWQLGIAVANEAGYNPIAKTFATEDQAREWATELNRHIGRSKDEVLDIVTSTMGGSRVMVQS